jgi:hypothetical protein
MMRSTLTLATTVATLALVASTLTACATARQPAGRIDADGAVDYGDGRGAVRPGEFRHVDETGRYTEDRAYQDDRFHDDRFRDDELRDDRFAGAPRSDAARPDDRWDARTYQAPGTWPAVTTYGFNQRAQFQAELRNRVSRLDGQVAQVAAIGTTGERRARYLREQQQAMLNRVDALDNVTEDQWVSARSEAAFRMRELEHWFENEARSGR